MQLVVVKVGRKQDRVLDCWIVKESVVLRKGVLEVRGRGIKLNVWAKFYFWMASLRRNFGNCGGVVFGKEF